MSLSNETQIYEYINQENVSVFYLQWKFDVHS